MAQRITTVVRLDANGTWQYEFTGTPPFALYRLGRLLAPTTFEDVDAGYTTNDTTRIFIDGTEYEPPMLEVLDSTDSYTPDNVLYPAYLILQWREAANAVQYRVDRYVGAAWVRQQYITASNAGYYTYETPALIDGESYQYRVVPINAAGDDLIPVAYSTDMVTIPEAPSVVISCAAGVVTAEARV